MSLKILLISHKFYPDVGGIETISELLANAFSKAGHAVHVLTWSVDHSAKPFQFKIVRNPGLRQLFREHAWADVIFENNPSLRLSWPAFIYGRPSIVVLQTWLPGVAVPVTFSNRVKSLHLKRATKVVAISNAVRAVCWPGATLIANSYNADEFKLIHGIPRTKDFVFVGRLVSDKGADLAIRAINLLNQQAVNNGQVVNPYSLTIIGEGPEREDLNQLVVQLGMQECVKFTGSLRGPELASALNEHRYMLVPSVWQEPFGIVALEGMACGCLPIVSDGGGLPDAVGNAGMVFNSGNVESLVDCIQHLSVNPVLERQVRQAAKEHLKLHHPDKISQDYLDIIARSAINQKRQFGNSFAKGGFTRI